MNKCLTCSTDTSNPKYCSLSCQMILKNGNARLKRIDLYLKHPSVCKQCSSPIEYDKKHNIFCSHACSARHNNQLRPTRTVESRKKTSDAHKKRCPPKTNIVLNTCTICDKRFYWRIKKQTCSKSCCNLSHKLRMKKLIANGYNPRLNRGRHKKSYLEKSFGDWLNQHGVDYKFEHKFRNEIKKVSYFVDFYFPELNLIIELDGTQHNTSEAMLHDKERDKHISKTYNLNIIRISHKEYTKQLRVDEIKQLLGI